jgi:hypothetical protein
MKGKKMRDIETINESNRKASAVYAAQNRTPMPVWDDDLCRRSIVKSLVRAIPRVNRPEGFHLVGVISAKDDIESAIILNGGGRYYGRLPGGDIGVFVRDGAAKVFPTRL